MALGQSIMTPKGTVSFWIIGTTWRDNFNKTAFVSLYGFESREHCDLIGSVYKEKIEYNIYPADFDKYLSVEILKNSGKCDIEQLYDFIKENDTRFFASDNLIFEGESVVD